MNTKYLYIWPSLTTRKPLIRLNTKQLVNAVKKQGVQTKFINILKKTYDCGTTQLKTDIMSKKIKIMKEVRQGDTLSPILFTSALK